MDQLSKLVHTEAAKSGISKQQADKAVRMIRDGKVNMSQVAPHLKNMIMQNMTGSTNPGDLRDKLSAKRQSMSEVRMSKQSRAHLHNKTKQQIVKHREKEEQDKQINLEIKQLKKEEYLRSLSELESKIGKVSDGFYNGCLFKLHQNSFADDTQRVRCQSIVDLYQQQQQFADRIADGLEFGLDLDLDDNLSDLSEDDE